MRRRGEHTPMLREYLRPENIVTDLAGSADEIFNKLISLNTTADEQLKLRAAVNISRHDGYQSIGSDDDAMWRRLRVLPGW